MPFKEALLLSIIFTENLSQVTLHTFALFQIVQAGKSCELEFVDAAQVLLRTRIHRMPPTSLTAFPGLTVTENVVRCQVPRPGNVRGSASFR